MIQSPRRDDPLEKTLSCVSFGSVIYRTNWGIERKMSIKRPWLDAIRSVVGQAHVRVDPLERRAYGRDLWPRLQLERLQNLSSDGPDAIIWPACVNEVAQLVKICRDHRISIVPYGAGSGVCGGALAAPGSVVIDLKRLKRIRNLT